MTKSVYDVHDAAFGKVTAAVVLCDGRHVAKVTMKHGNAVSAFVHWIGTEMTTGRAGGGGYDRATAAVEAAAMKGYKACSDGDAHRFWDALIVEDGRRWDRRLEDAGYAVLFAIA